MSRPTTPQSSSFPALPVQATFICSLRSKPSPFSSRKPSLRLLDFTARPVPHGLTCKVWCVCVCRECGVVGTDPCAFLQNKNVFEGHICSSGLLGEPSTQLGTQWTLKEPSTDWLQLTSLLPLPLALVLGRQHTVLLTLRVSCVPGVVLRARRVLTCLVLTTSS